MLLERLCHNTAKSGIIVLTLAIFGYLKLNIKNKIYTLFSAGIITFLALNILTFDWFILFRVSTRFWFPIIIIIMYLAAKGLDYLTSKNKKLLLVFGLLSLIEYLLIGKYIFSKPIKLVESTPPGIIAFLAEDVGIYRVFCLTKCIRQKDAAINNIELVEGYGTLQQKNYFGYSQQLAQGYWDKKYTLSIPPFQNYIYEKFKPYPPALTTYRVKYVISPYELSIMNLKLIKIIDQFYLYQNELYVSPNYNIYKPNFIRVVVKDETLKLTIPEVYSPSWNAYLNGIEKVDILESIEKTRSVNIKSDTKFVDFKYEAIKFSWQ